MIENRLYGNVKKDKLFYAILYLFPSPTPLQWYTNCLSIVSIQDEEIRQIIF